MNLIREKGKVKNTDLQYIQVLHQYFIGWIEKHTPFMYNSMIKVYIKLARCTIIVYTKLNLVYVSM